MASNFASNSSSPLRVFTAVRAADAYVPEPDRGLYGLGFEIGMWENLQLSLAQLPRTKSRHITSSYFLAVCCRAGCGVAVFAFGAVTGFFSGCAVWRNLQLGLVQVPLAKNLHGGIGFASSLVWLLSLVGVSSSR